MMKTEIQNVALVYLPQGQQDELRELYGLVESAMGKVTLTVSQNRTTPDPKTLIGSGKTEELRLAIENCTEKPQTVLFSRPLDAIQRRNLQEALGLTVIDNIDLILDIFALRATTAEGKKQVELAQLTYKLATRSDKDFSRQGAGIGTRGPGETQLETDKRIAREKIYRLRRELKEIAAQRDITRKKRRDNQAFTVALAGYTNAGKSTLFNALTGADVYKDDRLFATLDTTVRKFNAEEFPVLLCDTVGFIRNLPTMLVDAFKSTLEEVTDADLVLNVCDASDPDVEQHISVTTDVLRQLGVTAPVLTVYNKCDKCQSLPQSTSDCIYVSATENKNLDALKEAIARKARKQYAAVTLTVPLLECGKLLSLLNGCAVSVNAHYDDTHAEIRATVRRKYLSLFARYLSV